MLWPIVVLLLRRKRLAVLACVIFLGTPLLRGLAAAHGVSVYAIYNLSLFRFDGLAAGALPAIWARSEIAGRLASVRIAGFLLTSLVLVTVIGVPFAYLEP